MNLPALLGCMMWYRTWPWLTSFSCFFSLRRSLMADSSALLREPQREAVWKEQMGQGGLCAAGCTAVHPALLWTVRHASAASGIQRLKALLTTCASHPPGHYVDEVGDGGPGGGAADADHGAHADVVLCGVSAWDVGMCARAHVKSAHACMQACVRGGAEVQRKLALPCKSGQGWHGGSPAMMMPGCSGSKLNPSSSMRTCSNPSSAHGIKACITGPAVAVNTGAECMQVRCSWPAPHQAVLGQLLDGSEQQALLEPAIKRLLGLQRLAGHVVRSWVAPHL